MVMLKELRHNTNISALLDEEQTILYFKYTINILVNYLFVK